MEKKSYLVALIVIITLGFIQFFSRGIVHTLLKIVGKTQPDNLSRLIFYVIWLLSIAVAMIIIHGCKIKKITDELGLNRNILKGLLFAFLATTPMMIGYYLVSKDVNFSWTVFTFFALLPAFMEELLFRGFVFGQLYKTAKWGFIPAVFINALFFSLGHLGQSPNIVTSIVILLITFAGGGWFAWLFVEWEENLWVPAGLHLFMNLWWSTFKIGENAMGGGTANIFRGLTITLSIIITVIKSKKRGGLKVTRAKLWHNI